LVKHKNIGLYLQLYIPNDYKNRLGILEETIRKEWEKHEKTSTTRIKQGTVKYKLQVKQTPTHV